MARGWISGENPLMFDPHEVHFTSNGLAIFLCQVLIILALCYILGTIFQRLGQPKVVGELLAGVLLGPTAFGNIPGFSSTIVPTVSLPLLSLTSNIGLIFFILLVGLETDTDMIKRNARQVALIALPGMAIPFAISVGLANFIYKKSTDQSQEFTTFMLFVATVMAVTSLSVLSRIVSEMQMVTTVLGSVTIAAGALNDLLGYILLALGSSLASGGKQINALYQLLVALALFIFQWFAIRPLMFWMIGRSTFDLYGSSKQRVPNHLLVFTLLGALISAFITEACNLHPILGSLLFGIACPHGNFAVMVTEEIETVAVQILLPLYFVSSGLKADFKLLNTGLIWGELILVFAVVWISKVLATMVSTRIAGFNWRQAAFVAALMQSKSIIELIILNAGRELGVLNAQVYSMLFVTFIFSSLTVRPLAMHIWKSGDLLVTTSEDKAIETPSESTPSPKSAATEDDVAGRSSPEQVRTPFPMIAALIPANPAFEPLTALMQLVKRAPPETHSRIVLDVMRFVPNDNSTANIIRRMNKQGDEILDAVKMIAMMQDVPLVRQCDDRAADIVAAESSDDVISSLRARLQTLQRMYNGGVTLGNEDLGMSIAIVSWENNSHLAPSFDSDETNEEGHGNSAVSGYFSKANTMAAQLFQSLRHSTTGVLVESSTLLTGRGVPSAPSMWQREKELGLAKGRARRPRIVIPFFGGSDDRAAVQLAKLMASKGTVDVIVIKVERSEKTVPDEIVKGLQDVKYSRGKTVTKRASRAVRNASQATQDSSQIEEANMLTVNLQTINLEAEQHADARALFGTPLSAEADHAEKSIPTKVAKDAQPALQQAAIQHVDGVIFVSLTAQDVRATNSQTPLEAVLTYAAPLVHAQAGDMVFVGRGKLHQRTVDFRLQVQALQTANAQNIDGDGGKTLARVGHVLGACCEAVLSYGISANILVLQSGTTVTP